MITLGTKQNLVIKVWTKSVKYCSISVFSIRKCPGYYKLLKLLSFVYSINESAFIATYLVVMNTELDCLMVHCMCMDIHPMRLRIPTN